MRYLFLILSFNLLSSQVLHSGNYYSNLHGDSLHFSSYYDVLKLDDGNVMVGELRLSSDTMLATVVKTDNAGELLNETLIFHDLKSYTYLNRVDKQDSLIFAVGSALGQPYSHGLIVSIHPDGSVNWHKATEEGDRYRFESFLIANQSLLIVGEKNQQSVLVNTDFEGNILWEKLFGSDSLYNYARGIIQTNDGGFLISGFQSNEYATNSIQLIKLDEGFEITWKKNYFNSDSTYSKSLRGTRSVIESNDGGFYLAGCSETAPENFMHSVGYKKYRGLMMKIDQEGNLEWKKHFVRNQIADCFTNISKANDRLILLGRTWVHDSVVSYNTSIMQGWLVNTDKNGDVFWEKKYNHLKTPNNSFISSKYIQQNGDLILVGSSAFVENPMHQSSLNSWILKIDSCGFSIHDSTSAHFSIQFDDTKTIQLTDSNQNACKVLWDMGDGTIYDHHITQHTYSEAGYYTITLTTQAGNSTDTYVNHVYISDTTTTVSEIIKGDNFSIYPNPASNSVNIQLPDGELFDMQIVNLKGKIVYENKNVGGRESINISGLSAGVYVIQVSSSAYIFEEKLVIVK